MRDWLIQGLEYDLWANNMWIGSIPNLPRRDEMGKVMAHIAFAQRRWLERIGSPMDRPLCEKPETELPFLHERLIDLVQTRDLSEPFEYQTSKGEPFRNTLQEILLHIINHGTYHRGQLRGMVDDADIDLISDTDLVRFIRERSFEK